MKYQKNKTVFLRKMVLLVTGLFILALSQRVSAETKPYIHFFATDGGTFYIVNDQIGQVFSCDNFNSAKNSKTFDLYPSFRGGKDYVSKGGKYYIIHENNYTRTSSLQKSQDVANFTLHDKFQGGKHYFATDQYFYMITSDGKKYRRTTNMNTAANFDEFTLHAKCLGGEYYFGMEQYYFADVTNKVYHRVLNFNKNQEHKTFSIHQKVLDFLNKKSNLRTSFQTPRLGEEQADLILQNKRAQLENYYTFFRDEDGKTVVALYWGRKTSGGYNLQVEKVENWNGLIYVQVQEVNRKPGAMVTMALTYPMTYIKLDLAYADNLRFAVSNQDNKRYTHVASDDIAELVQKYAPQVRFHEDEPYFPVPVDVIFNQTYKITPLRRTGFTGLTTGVNPAVAMNGTGDVVEIHETSSMFNNALHYRVGKLEGEKVQFSDFHELTTGEYPTIGINQNGFVVEAHVHSSNDGIDLRYGKLAGGGKITLKAEYNLAKGASPSIDINQDNYFILAYEKDEEIQYQFGKISTDRMEVLAKGTAPVSGRVPSVAIDDRNQIILAYADAKKSSSLRYVTAKVVQNETWGIQFYTSEALADGYSPRIDMNNKGDVMVTYLKFIRSWPNVGEGAGSEETLFYQYGQLAQNGQNLQVTFCDEIEYCPGIESDIALNDMNQVLEIHVSVNGSDISYQVKTLKASVVRQLSDLPGGESGFILAPFRFSMWEASAKKLPMKTYVAVKRGQVMTEIQYTFFYIDNGTNASGMPDLRHMGDWERVIVRVDSTGKIVNCTYHHHSEATVVPANKLHFADQTHPIVYVGRETHGSYPDSSLVEFFDRISDKGKKWNVYSDQNSFEVVRIYEDGVQTYCKDWANWAGRWGTTSNSPNAKLNL